jgi:membrane-anchored protein YejM (alkaline phosphatase superfamily)
VRFTEGSALRPQAIPTKWIELSPRPGYPLRMRCKILFALACLLPLLAYAAPRTENIVLITYDGLRWQEIFGGADPALFTKENIKHFGDAQKMFWRETPEARRAALLPFLWETVAKQGQLLGNTNRGSAVRVTNGKNFSYPGYQELLAGFPDDRINSNEAGPNANVTVLEWLNAKPRYRGRVAAFASWDAFRDIINRERSGVFINAGNEAAAYRGATGRQAWLNEMMRDTLRPWETVRWDSLTHQFALEYLREKKPRVLYVAYDETDDWAHDGNYERVLRSAHQTDRFIEQIWNTLQSMSQYRGKTTLLITTDHGRGDAPKAW